MIKLPVDLPYYVEHALAGIGIAFITSIVGGLIFQTTEECLLVAGTMAGIFFYVGREVTDYKKGAKKDADGNHLWDVKALLGGIIGPMIFYFMMKGHLSWIPGIRQLKNLVEATDDLSRDVLSKTGLNVEKGFTDLVN
jgi:hypothetical protein